MMSDQSSYAASSAEAMAVIGHQFCALHPVDLIVTEKSFSRDYVVTDMNGNIVFKVKAKFLSFRAERTQLDAAGNPIVTFRHKALSAHGRWMAYRGESTESKDLLFSIRKASFIQMFETRLDVFLASNTSENTCDFHIKGSSDKACTVYRGNSNVIVAQMKKKHRFLGNGDFRVTVYPNVDSAFIISLIVLLDEITKVRQRAHNQAHDQAQHAHAHAAHAAHMT